MKCRLLYLIGQLGPGGSERQLFYLLERMNRERYQPEVVVWNYVEDAPYISKMQALGVPIHAMPIPASRWAKLTMLRRLVRQLQPEVLHSYSYYTNLAVRLATLGTQTIAIGAVREDFLQAEKTTGLLLGKCNARWPRCQIFNNFAAATAARHTRRFFTPEHLFVVRNGLDLQRFRSVPFVPTQRAHIVGVGTLLPVKRWERLLRAARTLRQQGYNFLVQIVGDGPLHTSLLQEAHRLDITDCVEFLGYRDDIPDILGKATFVSHTAESEGCPNVVMEAMACGRAVVAMDVGDTSSLVEDGKTGFVVSRGDEAQFVQCMATLIADHDLCRRMGEAGRLKAEREFGLDRLVPETFAAYQTVGWKDAEVPPKVLLHG